MYEQKKLQSHETVKEMSCYSVTSGTTVCQVEQESVYDNLIFSFLIVFGIRKL